MTLNLIRCGRATASSAFSGAVQIDGERLDPGPSQVVWNHSPDGFSWGYGGSGPAQLALAILLHVTGDPDLSVRLHQQFKQETVALLPQEPCILAVDVAAWVEAQIVVTEPV